MNLGRIERSFASGFTLAVLLIGGGAVITHPASAAAAIGAVQSVISCRTTVACVSGTNTSSGPGVAGTSASGFGVSGTSTTGKGIDGTSASNVGVKGLSNSSYGVEGVSNKSYGLWATTLAGAAAVLGTSSVDEGIGVYGYEAASPYGYAIFGNAPNGGFGVYGTSGANGNAVVGDASGGGNGTTGVSSSGFGAEGVSSDGFGVRGVSNSSYGVVGSTTGGLAGVMGQAPGIADYGVYGFNSANNEGVGGFGVYGVAEARGTGVYGLTSSGDGDGVVGYAGDTGTGVYGSSVIGDGVAGLSTVGYGVIGTSGSSAGVYASSTSGDAIVATSTNGFGLSVSSQTVAGVDASSVNAAGVYSTSTHGDGVYASSFGSTGVYAVSTDANGIESFSTTGAAITGLTYSSHPSIQGFSVQGSYSFGGYDFYSGNNTFYVDDSGNIGYTGSINNFARIRGVGLVKTFSPRTAAPTVEDTGTAQLVDGEAVVRLDPVFAASMEPRASYRVFVTPDGDTNGLYVPQKTAAGFIVRESKGGRSTVSFDYRVVATGLGQLGERMSVADGTALPRSVRVNVERATLIAPPARPKMPRAPRMPSMRTPLLPQTKLPRPPSQAALAPRSLR